MKNKVIAALLAIFLANLGLHKFYLSKIALGVVYLVIGIMGWLFFFVPNFILGFIGLIEGIILLSMDQKRFDLKYNKP